MAKKKRGAGAGSPDSGKGGKTQTLLKEGKKAPRRVFWETYGEKKKKIVEILERNK